MTSIGLHRLVARCGMLLIVDALRWKTPTIGRQDKAGDPAAVAALLFLCLHVVFCAPHDGPPNWGCGPCAASLFVFNAPSAVAARPSSRTCAGASLSTLVYDAYILPLVGRR
jgi:hypothetical protein